VIIATSARSNHIGPDIQPVPADRRDVIPRQVARLEALPAVHTQVGIALEQRWIIQGRDVTIAVSGQYLVTAVGRDNGIDINPALAPGYGANSAVHTIQQAATTVGHLIKVIQTHRVLVIDPFQWHSGRISTQDLLMQVVHVLPPKTGVFPFIPNNPHVVNSWTAEFTILSPFMDISSPPGIRYHAAFCGFQSFSGPI
jgi:hypothetical protein